MTRKSAHAQKTSSRSRRAQTALALTLAVATCLLVLPAVASAKVDKKYAKAYAAKVGACAAMEDAHRREYNGFLDNLVSTANEMKPLIGSPDPDDQIRLGQLTQFAQEAHDMWVTQMTPAHRRTLKVMKAVYPDCKAWFSQAADKVVFHGATSQLVRGFDATNDAFMHLATSYGFLAQQNIAGAQAEIAQAAKVIGQAEPNIDAGLARLKALER